MSARALIALAAMLLLTAGVASARDVNQHVHETFPVGEDARLDLRSEDGDVEVSVWDRDEIEIDVIFRADWKQVGGSGEPGLEFELSQEGDIVRAGTKETGGHGFMTMIDVDEYLWTIRVPAHCEVDVRGEDGDVTVADVRGELRLTVDDGDVKIESVASPSARIRLEDGDLEMKGCSGDFLVRIEDGDADLRRHSAGPLEIQAEDGDVDVRLEPGGELELEVEAEDGDVDVHLASGIGAEFVVATYDGTIRLDLDAVDGIGDDRGNASGKIGDGGGRIRIETQDGDVLLRSRAGS